MVASGRARNDVVPRVAGTGVVEVLGNHGYEPGWRVPEVVAAVAGWHRQLERELAGVAGLEIEDKGISLAVHYRRLAHQRSARDAVLQAARVLRGEARLVWGKCVLNVLSSRTPNRATALERERYLLRCDASLYVGDDWTDEDVFAFADLPRVFSIRVGPSARSRARYCLRSQGEVDELLRLLADLR